MTRESGPLAIRSEATSPHVNPSRAYAAVARITAGILAAFAIWPLAALLTWDDTFVSYGGARWAAGLLVGWTLSETVAAFGILFLEVSAIAQVAKGWRELRITRSEASGP